MKRLIASLLAAVSFATLAFAAEPTIVFRYKATDDIQAPVPQDPDSNDDDDGHSDPDPDTDGDGDQDPGDPDGDDGDDDIGDGDGDDTDPGDLKIVDLSSLGVPAPGTVTEVTVYSNDPNNLEGLACFYSAVEGAAGTPVPTVVTPSGASGSLRDSLASDDYRQLFELSAYGLPGTWYFAVCGRAIFDDGNDGGKHDIVIRWTDEESHAIDDNHELHVIQDHIPLSIDLANWRTSIDLTNPVVEPDLIEFRIVGGVPPYQVTNFVASPEFQVGGWSSIAPLLEAEAATRRDNGIHWGVVYSSDYPQIRKTSIQNADEYAECASNGGCYTYMEQCDIAGGNLEERTFGFTVTDSIGASVTMPATTISVLTDVTCSNEGYPHHWVSGYGGGPMLVNDVTPPQVGQMLLLSPSLSSHLD